MRDPRNTRDDILAAAQEEFLEKGYQAAALRDISKRAGVTTGALYGYFSNKLDLFEALVKEPYHALIDQYHAVLQEFTALSPAEQKAGMMDYTGRTIRIMTDYIYTHKQAFRLILCCSEGTEYNNLVHEMAELDVTATHNFAAVNESLGVSMKPVNANLEHMLTSGMFSTYFELIIHDIPRSEADEYIQQLLEFYAAGWAKIMGF